MTATAAERDTPRFVTRSASGDLAVVCEGLSKRFPVQKTWAQLIRHPIHRDYAWSVRDVSFSVQRGEFFGFLGPNGAGKTTLFRLLSSTFVPDAGWARVNGFDIEKQGQQVRRSISSVLANDRTLHWRLPARENLRLYAALYGLYGAEASRRIEELLELVGLAHVDEKMVANFSSGMRQRLAVARALLGRPPILFLDEPTRSLDPISARDLREFLRREICDREGCTVLLATHETDEAFRLCDRVAVLDRGEMIATGRSAELVDRFGDEVYRVWTRTPDHPAFRMLADAGQLTMVGHPVKVDSDWVTVEVEIVGDLDRAAATLARLVDAGVTIARYERVPLSLADLLERVVAARVRAAGGGNAA